MQGRGGIKLERRGRRDDRKANDLLRGIEIQGSKGGRKPATSARDLGSQMIGVRDTAARRCCSSLACPRVAPHRPITVAGAAAAAGPSTR